MIGCSLELTWGGVDRVGRVNITRIGFYLNIVDSLLVALTPWGDFAALSIVRKNPVGPVCGVYHASQSCTPESVAQSTDNYKFDLPGVITFMITMLSLQILVTKGNKIGWVSSIGITKNWGSHRSLNNHQFLKFDNGNPKNKNEII